MLFRFSLYGFLKNLRFFEPFFLLALREHGLSFAAIGGLIAIREVAVNIFEIPSGVLADAWGRRRCMVASMAFFVLAFLILGLAQSFSLLALGMVCFGFADAFRTGTHKALIFSWLRAQGREAERVKVYGFTRSWSKLGSALSALVAGVLVIASNSFVPVFLWSAVPAAVNLVNLYTYPRWLDPPQGGGLPSVETTWRRFVEAVGHTVRSPQLRGLVTETIAVEGTHSAAEDYLQPIVVAAAVSVPVLLDWSTEHRIAVAIAITYACLHVLASGASRRAHAFEERAGGTRRAARLAGHLNAALYIAIGGFLAAGWAWAAIPVFLAVAVVQNLWRPLQIARFDTHGEERWGATTMSIEAQAKAGGTALLAPVLGWIVDWTSGGASPVPAEALWPLALCALPWAILNARPRHN